ncbi:hypothetical protein CR513_57802, partial [Mucuna pruriens]
MVLQLHLIIKTTNSIILNIKLYLFKALLEPAVLHDFRNRNPGLRVSIKESREKFSKFWGKPPRTAKLTPVNLLIHGHNITIMKRQITGHQNEQNNPTRPNINLGTVVPFPCQNLGSNVSRCPTKSVEQPVLPNLIGHGTEAEVGDFKVSVLVEQQVLGLEPSLGDLVEELAAADELHDELDDVGVADAAEDGDLALDVGHQTALQDLVLAYDLDGHTFPSFDVPRMVDLREGSVSEELPELEPAQDKVRVFLLRRLCHGDTLGNNNPGLVF